VFGQVICLSAVLRTQYLGGDSNEEETKAVLEQGDAA
jgi:hypothetical protein